MVQTRTSRPDGVGGTVFTGLACRQPLERIVSLPYARRSSILLVILSSTVVQSGTLQATWALRAMAETVCGLTKLIWQ